MVNVCSPQIYQCNINNIIKTSCSMYSCSNIFIHSQRESKSSWLTDLTFSSQSVFRHLQDEFHNDARFNSYLNGIKFRSRWYSGSQSHMSHTSRISSTEYMGLNCYLINTIWVLTCVNWNEFPAHQATYSFLLLVYQSVHALLITTLC